MPSLTIRREIVLLFALLLIAGYFAVVSPHFLSARNLSLLLTELAITGTLALGMLLVLLPGHIDLSAGSGVGLIGGISAVLVTNHHWPAPIALLAGFAVAIALWWGMGSLIVLARIPAFIITLGGLLVFKGLFWLVIESHTVPVVSGGGTNLYSQITTFYLTPFAGLMMAGIIMATVALLAVLARRDRHRYGLPVASGELTFLQLFLCAQIVFLFVLVLNQSRGIPFTVLILAGVAGIVWVLTRHSVWGRYLYATGGNEEAAVISGVPVARTTITAFVLMGGIVALTGFMQTAYGGASTTTVGDLMELDAVAACVIGGVSLRGGRGTVPGVLCGALIMTCLINGMTLLAVQPELKFIARGTVLILAVWLDTRISRPG